MDTSCSMMDTWKIYSVINWEKKPFSYFQFKVKPAERKKKPKTVSQPIMVFLFWNWAPKCTRRIVHVREVATVLVNTSLLQSYNKCKRTESIGSVFCFFFWMWNWEEHWHAIHKCQYCETDPFFTIKQWLTQWLTHLFRMKSFISSFP